MQLTAQFPRFRDRITFYSVSETADTYGGLAVPVETSLGSAWAAVEKTVSTGTSASGGEPTRAGGIVTEASILITTWYRSDITITPKCIAKLGTRTFDIQDINDVENKHQYLVIFCKERGD